jgi:hypothetical protein
MTDPRRDLRLARAKKGPAAAQRGHSVEMLLFKGEALSHGLEGLLRARDMVAGSVFAPAYHGHPLAHNAGSVRHRADHRVRVNLTVPGDLEVCERQKGFRYDSIFRQTVHFVNFHSLEIEDSRRISIRHFRRRMLSVADMTAKLARQAALAKTRRDVELARVMPVMRQPLPLYNPFGTKKLVNEASPL